MLKTVGGLRTDGKILPFPFMEVAKKQQGVSGATVEADLDMRAFENDYLPCAVSPEVLAENRRDKGEQLRALRLVARNGAPTVTAILVLGRDPRYWFPGAYLRFVRYDGTASRVRRSGRVRVGHCPEAVMTTVAFFNNKGGVGKTSLVYHLAWMLRELGGRVIAADLDPQANLTGMFLDETGSERWTRMGLWYVPHTVRAEIGKREYT